MLGLLFAGDAAAAVLIRGDTRQRIAGSNMLRV